MFVEVVFSSSIHFADAFVLEAATTVTVNVCDVVAVPSEAVTTTVIVPVKPAVGLIVNLLPEMLKATWLPDIACSVGAAALVNNVGLA